jgi:putative heme-binding domain-containing protein
MYVCDFHDARTAHPDPDAKWDTSNGRIYRIQAQGTKPTPKFDLSQRSTGELVDLLRQPNGWYAQQARRILAERHDVSAGEALAKAASQPADHEQALQALWAAHGCGAFDEALALSLLDHPSEHVRAWTVRLAGDRREVDAPLAARFAELAQRDGSVIVRAQLASTAKRLLGPQALPIIQALLMRDEDDADPFVPLLIWWALEDKALPLHGPILDYFCTAAGWRRPLVRGNMPRLMRRFAASGSAAGYEACERLWRSTPAAHQEEMLQTLHQGLTERSRGLNAISSAGLFDNVAAAAEESPPGSTLKFEPITSGLRQVALSLWKAQPDDVLRLGLALEAGLDEPYSYLLKQLDPGEPVSRLKERLGILADYGRDDCVQPVLALAGEGRPDELRLAALSVLQRFAANDTTAALLAAYPKMTETLKTRTRDLFFGRPQSALAFLEIVDGKRVAAADVPVDQLRRLALFKNDEIDALVRKHWGNVQPGTPEEKLADIRRFSNDLRAGPGDAAHGKTLFAKQCGTCHKLHGEGNAVGPELTNTVKGDLPSLLANIVDPSAVVKRDFLSYLVVTKAGVLLTGLLVEQDAASVTLLDAKNQRLRVSRDQIDEMNESTTSLMPEKLLEQLSPQELRDLFAYLRK